MSSPQARPLLPRLCGGLGMMLILLVVLLCLPLTLPRLLGYEVFAIVSGSMEPALPTGSLVYAKATQPETVSPGDILVFYAGPDTSTAITHRVVENDTERQQFITRGDANDGNDPNPVLYHNVVGTVAAHLPLLGYVLPALSTLGGKISLLGVLLAALLLRVVASRLQAADGD